MSDPGVISVRDVPRGVFHLISPGTRMVDFVGATLLYDAILFNQIMPDTAQVVVKAVVNLDCDQVCIITGEEGICSAPYLLQV